MLRATDLLRAGVVLMSGTIPMHHGVDQFASHGGWNWATRRPANVIDLAYRVRPLPNPIG